MNKRKELRYKTRQLVKVCGKLGVVNDVSLEGLQVSTAYSPQDRKVDVAFEFYGKVINIMGIIRWIKRKQMLQSPNELGIVIEDPPPEYVQFVEEFKTQ